MSKIIIKFLRNGIYRSFIFHIVVCDKNAKKGYFIEKLGYYSPIFSINGKKELVINFMRLAFWLNRGAILHKSVLKYIAIALKKKI